MYTLTLLFAHGARVQVHFATLNGKRVVVKVQRPGLRQLFDVDLRNVRVIAQWLQVCSRSWLVDVLLHLDAALLPHIAS